MIKIRQAEINDSKIILDCIRGLAEHVNQLHEVSATEQDIKDSFFDANSHIKAFIAETDEKLVCGFALIFKTFSTFKAKSNFFLEDLYVFPEFRNRGVGFSLFNYVKEYAQKHGAQKIEWYVNNANVGAIGFYEKIGAKKLDYKSIYYMEIQ